MSKFKVGDIVRNKQTKILDIVEKFPGMYEYDTKGYFDSSIGFVLKKHSWDYQQDWELLNNKNSMSLKTIFKKLVDADTQTLSKAGFLNGDLELTEEGQKELLSQLFFDKKADLVKVAQEKIDEEAKNK